MGEMFNFAKGEPGTPGPAFMVGLFDTRLADGEITVDAVLREFNLVGNFLENYKAADAVDSSLGGMPARERTFLGHGPGGVPLSGQMMVATDGSYFYWAFLFDEQNGKALTDMANALNTLKWVEETPKPLAPVEPKPKAVAAATPEKPKSFLSRMSQAILGEGGAPSADNALAQLLDGQLVTCSGGEFEPYDSTRLSDKKYVGVYFSASWCGPCRRFTPRLVEWYRMYRDRFDNFEVIFVSSDRSERDMASYMAEDGMQWPAIQYSRARKSILEKYSGRGIPCFVVLDESGSVVAHSYEGEQYVGPMRPLEKLTKLIEN